jgi:hypothetical protein
MVEAIISFYIMTFDRSTKNNYFINYVTALILPATCLSYDIASNVLSFIAKYAVSKPHSTIFAKIIAGLASNLKDYPDLIAMLGPTVCYSSKQS